MLDIPVAKLVEAEGECLLINIEQITDYLSENISDSVQQFIFIKEIEKKDSASADYINAYEQLKKSKWYHQLADEQWVDGSWGRFHTQDSKALVKQKFVTTEVALRRAHELGITKDDPLIAMCIELMENYIQGNKTWTDNIEKHKDNGKGHMFCRRFITAARLNMFDSENPAIEPLRCVVVETLKTAFATGCFDGSFWEKKVEEYYVPSIVAPGSFYGSMLLQNSKGMDDTLQRQWLDYIWHIKGGICYVSSVPPAEKQFLEDRQFEQWLSTLELLSGFSLFPNFMKDDVLQHLLNEAARLMNGDAVCNFKCYYADSYRDKNKYTTDCMLRIARTLVKCCGSDVH